MNGRNQSLKKLLTIKPRTDLSDGGNNGKQFSFQIDPDTLKRMDDADLAKMLLKQVSKETGMNKCPLCDGDNVVNQVTYNLTSEYDKDQQRRYDVGHVCCDCVKGWNAKIIIDHYTYTKIAIESIQPEEITTRLLYKILLEAKEQIENHIAHNSEKIEISEM